MWQWIDMYGFGSFGAQFNNNYVQDMDSYINTPYTPLNPCRRASGYNQEAQGGYSLHAGVDWTLQDSLPGASTGGEGTYDLARSQAK